MDTEETTPGQNYSQVTVLERRGILGHPPFAACFLRCLQASRERAFGTLPASASDTTCMPRSNHTRFPLLVPLVIALAHASCGGESVDEDHGRGNEDSGSVGGAPAGGQASTADGGDEGGAVGGSVSTGGQADAGAGGTVYLTAGAGGTVYLAADYCFDPGSLENCEERGDGLEAEVLLFDATTLGTDARFLGMDGATAWLEIPGENDTVSYRVVSVEPLLPEEQVYVQELDLSELSGQIELKYAWSGWVEDRGLSLKQVNALACDDERCMLLTASPEDAALSPVPHTDLPTSVDKFSLLSSIPCAYGTEVHCWGGTGFEVVLELPPGAGSRFTHFEQRFSEEVDFPDAGIAVTDVGAVFLTDGDGEFQMVVPPNSKLGSVTDVDFDGWRFSVLFESGAWWLGEPSRSEDEPDQIDCFGADEMRFVIGSELPRVQVIDRDGQRFQRFYDQENEPEPGYSWCRVSQPAVPALRFVSQDTCGLAINVFGVTETALIGLTGSPQCIIG